MHPHTLPPQSQGKAAGQQPLSVLLAHWPGARVRFWYKPNPQEWNGFCPGELCLHRSEPVKRPRRQKVLFSLTTVKLHQCDKCGLFSSLFPPSSRSYLDCSLLEVPSPRATVQTRHPRLFNITQRDFRAGLPCSLLLDCEHNAFAPLGEQPYGCHTL